MSPTPSNPPRLTSGRKAGDVLLVTVAGDWLDRAGLPDTSGVDKALAGGGVRALEFDTSGLGRWDSALLVRILAICEACGKEKIDFRAATLPTSLSKLIALSQA